MWKLSASINWGRNRCAVKAHVLTAYIASCLLLKACWWLLFALRIQPRMPKEPACFDPGWSCSVLLCHFPVSGSYFLRHHSWSASDVHSAWTSAVPWPCATRTFVPSVAAQRDSKERLPTLSHLPPPGPLPPVFSLRFQSLIIVSALLFITMSCIS